MKTRHAHRLTLLGVTVLAVVLGISARSEAASFGTAFTYQVRLTESGGPANGAYDLTFALFDAANGGNQVGGSLTNLAVTATNSLISLPLDFGASAFGDGDRWLQIGVRTNGSNGGFALFNPRQPLTPTPYAIVAASANALNGTLPDAQIPASVARLGSNQTFTGTANFNPVSGAPFTVGSTNKVASLNVDLLDGLDSSAFWKLGGNSGTSPGANFVGTSDNQPLEFKVNSARALRLEPNASLAPNVIGGAPGNFVAAGYVACTIAGGGSGGQGYTNSITANLSTIGGGFNNTIQKDGYSSVISGGGENTIQTNASYSSILGGLRNTIQAAGSFTFATIGGGANNTNAGQNGFIGGGGFNYVSGWGSSVSGGRRNQSTADGASVGGGWLNSATSAFATVAGGTNNAIQANAIASFIGGGNANVINNSYDVAGNANYATIGGGAFNLVGVHDATIAGGLQNRAGGAQSTVAGGYNNFAYGVGAAVGGGWNNYADAYAVVAGGIGNSASVPAATVGGGTNNSASGFAATVPGGFANNAGGNYSLAAGRRAKATHTGSFVWADATDADLATTATNQFLIRASGGVGIGTNNPAGAALNVNGAVTATSFSGNGSGLTSVSAGQLTGTLPSAQLSGTYSGAVTLSNTANSFTGNGTGLTNVNAVTLGGLNSSSLWQLGGNTLSSGQFLGSTNHQPVTIKVNGIQALQISPTTNDSNHSNIVNIVGGSPVNFIAPGVYGAVIAGGGAQRIGGFSFTNSVSADFGVIGGGYANTIQSEAFDSTIGGGAENTIQNDAAYSTIGGGGANTIQPNAGNSTIGGGAQNSIQTSSPASTIGGGNNNTIRTAYRATIGGGGYNTVETNASVSTIGGGTGNTIQTGAANSTIGGGYQNTIQPNAHVSTISGGDHNTIQTNAYVSTISGGSGNTIQPNAHVSTIGGGSGNTIQDYAEHSTIGGGILNTIQNSAFYSTIAGGGGNTIQTNALVSTIGGGDQNTIQANAYRSTIGGGRNNTNSGAYASVPGGDQNVAGTNSFAAGHRAKATHTGSFVWADATDADLATTAEKQFLIRASGGVGIGTNNPQSALHVVGTVTATTFNPPSDRNLKENFAPVSPRGVLAKVVALPISRWNFKGDSATPHLGPMAQDFHAAFGVGTDDRHISTVDADGVALAAIQGLHEIVKEKDAETEALKRSVAELKAAVNSLAEKSGAANR